MDPSLDFCLCTSDNHGEKYIFEALSYVFEDGRQQVFAFIQKRSMFKEVAGNQIFEDQREYHLCRKYFCCDAPLEAEIRVFFDFGNGLKKEEKSIEMRHTTMKRVPRLFFKFSDRPLGIAKLPSTVQLSIGGKTSPVFRIDVQFSNVDEEQPHGRSRAVEQFDDSVQRSLPNA